MKFWLRWAAVIPGGIPGMVLLSFPLHWFVLMVTSEHPESGGIGLQLFEPETLERLGMAFFTAGDDLCRWSHRSQV